MLDALRLRLQEIESGSYVSKSKQPVGQLIIDWLENHISTHTRLKTQETYECILRYYVIPAIGNVELQKLTSKHIQPIYADMLKRGLSRGTIGQTHRILRQALAFGVRQTLQQSELGSIWQNTGYVLTQADGTPIEPGKVSNDFARIVRQAGLPHLTLHGLRHAHATLMLLLGVSDKIVAERLGHGSFAITMDIYSHVLPGMQEDAVLRLDKLLSRDHNPDIN